MGCVFVSKFSYINCVSWSSNNFFSHAIILFHAALLFILKIIGWHEDGEVTREYT